MTKQAGTVGDDSGAGEGGVTVLDPRRVVVGRMVHYVLPDGRGAGEHRSAVIARVWGDGSPESVANLRVFLDGDNDYPDWRDREWATSRIQDPDCSPGTWHWPEGV